MLRARPRAGASAIEFALLLPVFIAILTFLLDYGVLFTVRAATDTAVLDGCREGSRADPSTESPADVASAAIDSRLETSPMLAHFCTTAGCDVSVTESGTAPLRALACDLEVPFGGLTGLVPVPPAVQVRTSVRLEHQE